MADSKEMTDLQAEVAETETVVASAIVLLKGLSERIKEAGTDPVKLRALTSQLDAKNAELAAAIVENTPAEPA